MFTVETVMRYVLQQKTKFADKNRFPSRSLDLKEIDLGYLSTMRREQKEEFMDIDPDESLMQYLNSQTGKMKAYLIESNQFWEYMRWEDQRKRTELKAQYKKIHDPDLYHAVGALKYNEKPFTTFVEEYLEDECNQMVAKGIRHEMYYQINSERRVIQRRIEDERKEEQAAERERQEQLRRRRKRRRIEYEEDRTDVEEETPTDDEVERAQ